MAGKLSRALKIHLASFPRWCYGRAASEQKGQGAGFREEGEPGKGSRSQASGSKSPPTPPTHGPILSLLSGAASRDMSPAGWHPGDRLM